MDTERGWIATVVRREVYMVPVEADTEQEAEMIACHALDLFPAEEFMEQYYFDDEWGIKVFPLDSKDTNLPKDRFIRRRQCP